MAGVYNVHFCMLLQSLLSEARLRLALRLGSQLGSHKTLGRPGFCAKAAVYLCWRDCIACKRICLHSKRACLLDSRANTSLLLAGYELREGLTPANYGMKGSPAGLARIDALFGGHGYTLTFTNAPVPFGAFPSLHAGCATMEALFLSYFFPVALSLPLPGGKRLKFDARVLYWTYAFWLYWCTMYLMHHYLVDLVGGACLATICFYCEFSPLSPLRATTDSSSHSDFLTDEMRVAMEQNYAFKPSAAAPVSALPAATVPRDGFGMRSSLDVSRSGGAADASVPPTRPDLVRPPSRASGVRLGGASGGDIKMEDLISRGKSPQPPVRADEAEAQRHVLFEANVEEGNDWDDDDDPKAGKSAAAGAE